MQAPYTIYITIYITLERLGTQGLQLQQTCRHITRVWEGREKRDHRLPVFQGSAHSWVAAQV